MTTDEVKQKPIGSKDTKKLVILIVVMICIAIAAFLPPPEGLGDKGLIMLSIAMGAAILWMTEALTIGVTGLFIIFLQSIFGILPLTQGLAYIAHPVNAVVLVGYLLAGALVNSGMDRRLSLTIISKMGEKTSQLILGIMIATAFLSMWMSNTATTAIMVPIATGILTMAGAKPLKSNFGKALFISIAFAANIGGMGTPTGTPANPIAIALLNNLAGIQLTFLDWTARALPLVILLIPAAWMIVQKVYPLEIKVVEGGLDAVKKQLKEMGPLQREEKRVVVLFISAVTLWLMDSFISLPSDWLYIVAVLLTIIIVTPKVGFMPWQEAQKLIGWDVLFLVGGGLSMGAGLKATGAIDWIAGILSSGMGSMPESIAIGLISAATGLGITIFCSLSGTATTFVPVAIGLALSFGWDPIAFAVAAGLSSSFAFLLPANAAPNAVAYGSGYFKTIDMFKAGVVMIIASIVIQGILAGFLLPLIF
ncbi:solute carrier family 13 (sodium-dependent dicarboxylate transporter), member 2/3/5 [Natronincola peptidivorans]|uniref:Solute carrier family 13 (Sodium-dependent dicarboxylate transporter), member 2/3/5 n=1 Tax=Natronincola peptidivorans TaxID=426128 RepID=A0A1I0A559_9FIRM|nr:DASS family sodium-coupled anion symporter [Natronincola peptidivorans]SES89230.1 solute carrier family 13 (sodium-dependent dicarboxylate transporter), member 2/3/5 [Natronincola peptidivorans]